MEKKRLSIGSAAIRTMGELPAGKEFNARQFKYWFDGVYGENGFYIDTVMRAVRKYCHLDYIYDRKAKLYRKVEINA